MLRQSALFVFVLSSALVFGACGESSNDGASTSDGGADDGGGAGGKADAVCDLGEDDDRWVTQFVLNDHLQSRCSDATGFVPTSCCETQIAQYREVSKCPPQAKWNQAEGTGRRCAEDAADTDGGAFVPTACCQPLCDEGATWREQDNGTYCVGAEGQFENSVCCLLADEDICDASDYDVEIAADGRRHCRDTRTGRFSQSACCIDKCFDIFVASDDEVIIPASCLDTVEGECDGSSLNAGGLCHDTETGRFVKAACCEWDEIEDPDALQVANDDAYLCEGVNDDVIACQTGDDGACDRQGAALAQADFTDGCCAVEQDEPFEFCIE